MFNTNHHFFTAEYTKTMLFSLENWFGVKPCKRPVALPPPYFKDGFK